MEQIESVRSGHVVIGVDTHKYVHCVTPNESPQCSRARARCRTVLRPSEPRLLLSQSNFRGPVHVWQERLMLSGNPP
jgi:hypothetical protein